MYVCIYIYMYVCIYIYILDQVIYWYMCVYLSTLFFLKELNLLWYLVVSIINIHVHEHIVIKQIYGLNIELDIQVNVQCVIA
jgi:hypothetical protein